MYSLTGHGRMIADKIRVEAYRRAIQRAVKPGSVVLDVGAGTGIMSLFACQAGARKVFAVEPDDIIQLARMTAAANRFLGKIEFIQDFSNNISLPERADVVVADINGVLPLHGTHLPTVVDIRKRLLKPGGIHIPQQAHLWAAIVESESEYARRLAGWDSDTYGLDLTAGRPLASNTASRAAFKAGDLLVAPQRWAVLDYRTIENPDVNASVEWTAKRAGSAHGVAFWFDTVLIDDIGFSNAPGKPEIIYGNLFMPWPVPIPIDAGDKIHSSIDFTLAGDDYRWLIETTFPGTDRKPIRQCSALGSPMSLTSIRKIADDHVPSLSDDGKLEGEILSLMQDGLPLREIAQKLAALHPDRFPTWQAALTRVGETSLRYSR